MRLHWAKQAVKAAMRGVLPVSAPGYRIHKPLWSLRRRAYARSAQPGYYSQYGQDRFVEALLAGRRGGVFLDVGAYDGVEYSNTCYFERALGWRGLCIEPHPKAYAALRRNRSCICVNGAVSAHGGRQRFMAVYGKGEMVSGLLEMHGKMDSAKSYIASTDSSTEEIEVACYTVDTVVRAYHIDRVDYVSIDTEGGEYDILTSIDLDRLDVEVISIENNYPDARIEWYLHHCGYGLKAVLGTDEIYQRAQ